MVARQPIEVYAGGDWQTYASIADAADALGVTRETVSKAARSWDSRAETAPKCAICAGTGLLVPGRVRGHFVRYKR